MQNRFLRRSFALALTVAAVTFSSGALAWGPEGHAIVADIATLHLTPQALAQVHKLLALEGDHGLDQISSWADAHRKDMPGTGPWHYVDIPLAANSYDAARDCKQDNCVVARIPYFTKILGDRSASPQARLRALKFLVHFVGDIHQPLHAEDHDDKGGNDVKLVYFGYLTNLHAIWDGRILEHALHVHTGPNYSFDHDAVWSAARKLDAGINPSQRLAWTPPRMMRNLPKTVVGWANQSHALARVAYADLPAHPKYGWSQAYQDSTWPVVKQQLQRGGLRLAAVLNATLR